MLNWLWQQKCENLYTVERLGNLSKMFPLWQCSNPIDKTPIGGQGASTLYITTCVFSKNSSTVHGSSSGNSQSVVVDISWRTASILNSTRSLARSIRSSRSARAVYTPYNIWYRYIGFFSIFLNKTWFFIITRSVKSYITVQKYMVIQKRTSWHTALVWV